jgi:hypothetical protein
VLVGGEVATTVATVEATAVGDEEGAGDEVQAASRKRLLKMLNNINEYLIPPVFCLKIEYPSYSSWLALNFHRAAPGIIILPSQFFKMVDTAQQGEALAFVTVPGAFFGIAIIYCLLGTVTVRYIRGVK